MEYKITECGDLRIAEFIADGVEIRNTQDAVNIMMECIFSGIDTIIFHEKNIIPDFFDLKTKIAGDILQKFSTYNARLAIVGDFEKYKSNSFRDFINESNKFKRINFVNSVETAIQKLSEK